MLVGALEAGGSMTKRILFITSTRIGDAVLSSGLLHHFVEAEPEAKFTVACGPLVTELFQHVPRLDRILPLRKQKRGGHWFELWKRTAPVSWHRVIDLRSSGLSYFLRTRHRHVSRKNDLHRVVAASEVVGLNPPAAPHLYHLPDDLERVRARLGRDPIVAVGATANWIGKRWPIERYAELLVRLSSDGAPFSGARFLILGAPDEKDMVSPLVSALPQEQVIDKIGALNLMDVYLHAKCARFFVGNDSGLMHLAAAAGVPTLGLFGPTNEKWYAPWGDQCAVVRGPRSYHEIVTAPGYDWRLDKSYMHDLEVDTVEQAVHDLKAQTEHQARDRIKKLEEPIGEEG